jgi:sRNA-binding carbon storage regulator CsrA
MERVKGKVVISRRIGEAVILVDKEGVVVAEVFIGENSKNAMTRLAIGAADDITVVRKEVYDEKGVHNYGKSKN